MPSFLNALAILHFLLGASLALPILMVLLLGTFVTVIKDLENRERATEWLTRTVMLLCVLCVTGANIFFHLGRIEADQWIARNWFSITGESFTFSLLVDGWSLGFALLSAIICAIVGQFSSRYLSRDPGYSRYFVNFGLFTLGILLLSFAGNTESLLIGWELLGISSALLIAFFHGKKQPLKNALIVFSVYRLGDAALLSASILIHHHLGSGQLEQLIQGIESNNSIHDFDALTLNIIVALALVAIICKSALFPFSSYLPKAMEGPTPSSAVFYGSLSVHAGVFLLWRIDALIAHAPVMRVVLLGLGIMTTWFSYRSSKLQNDVKSALAYNSLVQIGIIVIELALGLHTLAFFHIVGNAALRLTQFLRAPNAMEDFAMRIQWQDSDAGSSYDTKRPCFGYLIFFERGCVGTLAYRLILSPGRKLCERLEALDRMLVGERYQSLASINSPNNLDSELRQLPGESTASLPGDSSND